MKTSKFVVLLVVCSLLLSVASSSLAANRSWTGLASPTWENPGNWNPVGFVQTSDSLIFGDIVPDADSGIFSNSTLANPITIADLDLLNQAILRGGTDVWLTVTGATTLAGQSEARNVKLRTNNLTLSGASTFTDRFGLEVQNVATITPNATLAFDPSFDQRTEFKLTRTSGVALINNGTITVDQTLTIDAEAGGLLDLDGTTGDGRVLVRTMANGPFGREELGHLTINGMHNGDFNGTIDIDGGSLTMNSPWRAGDDSLLDIEGRLNGEEFTTSGDVHVDNAARLNVTARMQQANVTGTGDLRIKDLVVEGGRTDISTPLILSSDLLPDSHVDNSLHIASDGNLILENRLFAASNLAEGTRASMAIDSGGRMTIKGEATLSRIDAQVDGALNFAGPVDMAFPYSSNDFIGTGQLSFSNTANFETGSGTIDMGSIRVGTGGNAQFAGNPVQVDDLTVTAGGSISTNPPAVARLQIGSDNVHINNAFNVLQNVRIGHDSGGISDLVVSSRTTDNAPALEVGGSIEIGMGQPSTGLLTVTNGGIARAAGNVQIGGLACCGSDNAFTGTGHVYVTGDPTSEYESTLIVGNQLRVGFNNQGGDATLNLEPGGRVYADHLKVWDVGNVFMTGGFLDVNSFDKQSAGNFAHTGGVATIRGGTGNFNSSHSFGGTLQAMPEFAIRDGADVAVTSSWTMAPGADQHARAVVQGTLGDGTAPSTLRGTTGGGGADLNIGLRGSAALDVVDGGRVALNDDVILGAHDGSFGQIAIVGVQNGHRSRVEARRGTGSNILVGGEHGAGDGFLYIAGGGLATTSADVYVGRIPGATGTIIVEREQAGYPAELIATDDIFVAGTSSASGGVGTIDINSGGRVEADRMLLHPGGTVNLTGGELKLHTLDTGSFGGNFNMTDGLLQIGSFTGDLDIDGGILARTPGLDELHIAGFYKQGGDTTLQLNIGAVNDYDYLEIGSFATLNGILDLQFVDAGSGLYVPSLGDEFLILSAEQLQGEFDSILSPSLPTGLDWRIDYHDSSVELSVVPVSTPLLPGDFDLDGDVDRTDLNQWRAHYGGDGADTDGDNDSDGSDFLAWQRDHTGSGASGALAAAAVPEPAGLALMLIGLVGILAVERKK